MVFLNVYIGALTLKPSQYGSRPWETITYKFYDIFSSTLDIVKLDQNVTTNNIFRIIPVSNIITNKIRFFFDFFLTQKIIVPHENLNNFFKPISISNSIKLIKNNIFKLNNIVLNLNNTSVSIQDSFKINAFTKFYNFNLVYNFENLNNFNNFNLNYLNLIKTNYVFVNYNIRYYSSNLFLILKKFNKKFNKINFFFIGSKYTNSKIIKLIGTNSTNSLKKVLFSKLKIKNLFNKLKLNFFNTNFFNKKFNNFNLNLPGQNSINYFNLKNNLNSNTNSSLINIDSDLLNYNNFNFNYIINFNFNLVQNNIEKINLIIPTKSIFETKFNFVSNFKIFNFNQIYSKFNLFTLNLIKIINNSLDLVLIKFKTFTNFSFVKVLNSFLIFYYFYLSNNYTFSSKNLLLGQKFQNLKKKKNNF